MFPPRTAIIAVGMLRDQARKAGPLSASLPVIDTVEPVSAVLIGTLVFGEHSPAPLPG
jgi:hypothetical protein